MADSRYAHFASSDPGGPDAAFWEQKVYFNGTPLCRREIVPTLAATPGTSERAARMLLLHAPVADGQPTAKPPAAWFTLPIPTPGGAHLEDDEEDDLDEDDDLDEEDEEDEFLDDEDMDDPDDEDEAPSNSHLPLIG